jgi:thiol:disulfide interchange protein
MKFAAIILAGTLLFSDSRPIDYATAYQLAQEGNKPLLVLVTAEWCAPCKTMKSTTIQELMARNAFDGFYYTTVDLGKEEELARKLIGERGVPQLIMFEKNEGKWVRRYLRGIQSCETVESFINQAHNIRTANANSLADK